MPDGDHYSPPDGGGTLVDLEDGNSAPPPPRSTHPSLAKQESQVPLLQISSFLSRVFKQNVWRQRGLDWNKDLKINVKRFDHVQPGNGILIGDLLLLKNKNIRSHDPRIVRCEIADFIQKGYLHIVVRKYKNLTLQCLRVCTHGGNGGTRQPPSAQRTTAQVFNVDRPGPKDFIDFSDPSKFGPFEAEGNFTLHQSSVMDLDQLLYYAPDEIPTHVINLRLTDATLPKLADALEVAHTKHDKWQELRRVARFRLRMRRTKFYLLDLPDEMPPCLGKKGPHPDAPRYVDESFPNKGIADESFSDEDDSDEGVSDVGVSDDPEELQALLNALEQEKQVLLRRQRKAARRARRHDDTRGARNMGGEARHGVSHGANIYSNDKLANDVPLFATTSSTGFEVDGGTGFTLTKPTGLTKAVAGTDLVKIRPELEEGEIGEESMLASTSQKRQVDVAKIKKVAQSRPKVVLPHERTLQELGPDNKRKRR